MEVISTIPESTKPKALEVISTIPEPKKFTFRSFIKEIPKSPQKSTILLLGVALIISLILFGVFIISQNLSASRKVKQQDANYLTNLKKEKENNKSKAANLKKMQDETRKKDLALLKQVVENYRLENGYYPFTLTDMIPNYISNIPTDPQTKEEYYFLCSLDQNSYILKTTLSNGEEFEITN